MEIDIINQTPVLYFLPLGQTGLQIDSVYSAAHAYEIYTPSIHAIIWCFWLMII